MNRLFLLVFCATLCLGGCTASTDNMRDGLEWTVVQTQEEIGHYTVMGENGHRYVYADTLEHGSLEMR